MTRSVRMLGIISIHKGVEKLLGVLLLLLSAMSAYAQTGSIAGTVSVASTGEPLAGAIVFLGSNSLSARTDLNGEYEIRDVPLGTYTVRASSDGYLSEMIRNVVVYAGQATRVDIDLAEALMPDIRNTDGIVPSISTVVEGLMPDTLHVSTGSIAGTVSDASTGEPLSEVSVVVEGTALGAQTDLNGYYDIPSVPPGTYTVRVSSDGYETQSTENVVVYEGQARRLDINMVEDVPPEPPLALTGNIAGTISNASTGEPLSEVSVVVEGTALGAQTDLNGYYDIPSVPPGTYTVRVSSDGYETQSTENVVVYEGQARRLDINMVEDVPPEPPLALTGNIAGTISNASTGELLSEVSVILGGTTLGAQTDLNGYYDISSVPPGTYTVNASSDGNATTSLENVVVYQGQTTRLDINMVEDAAPEPPPEPTGNIAGTVSDASTGEPLSEVSVIVGGTALGTLTDINGYYDIPSVPPGTYTVNASSDGYATQRTDNVLVYAGQTRLLYFNLVSDREPIPGAVPRTRSMESAFRRSLAFPGWGQLYLGERRKGSAFVAAGAAAVAVAIGSAVGASQKNADAKDARQAYRAAVNSEVGRLAEWQAAGTDIPLTATTRPLYENWQRTYDEYRPLRNIALGATAAAVVIWAVNLIDIRRGTRQTTTSAGQNQALGRVQVTPMVPGLPLTRGPYDYGLKVNLTF